MHVFVCVQLKLMLLTGVEYELSMCGVLLHLRVRSVCVCFGVDTVIPPIIPDLKPVLKMLRQPRNRQYQNALVRHLERRLCLFLGRDTQV